MSGSAVTVLTLSKFSKSWETIQKTFPSQRDDLEAALVKQILKLKESPMFAQWEPLPSGSPMPDGMQFRKLEFGVSGFTGALSQWRLMYFYRPDQNTIWLLWLYSHRDYPKRPSADELQREIARALEEIDVSPAE